MLHIRHPRAYEPELRYALDAVFGELLGLEHTAEAHDGDVVEVALAGSGPEPRLVLEQSLFRAPAGSWLTPSSLPALPLPRWDLTDDPVRCPLVSPLLPVLYGRPLRGDSYLDERDGELRLGLDVLGSAFFMLTRYEEAVLEWRDEHGRFPAAASVAGQEGLLERPLVNEYAEIVRGALERLWPRLPCPRRAFGVCVSHDVDWPAAPPESRRAILGQVLRDAVSDLDPGLALRRLVSHASGRSHRPGHDIRDTFDYLMATSEQAGLRSAFYFIAGHTGPAAIDGTYTLDDPWIAALLRRIHERGHEIGLHGSYESFADPEQLRRELEALQRACAVNGIEQEEWGGRQHYLRFAVPATWQACGDAGLAYDSTLSFADAPGFRCGVCVDYPVFDVRARRRLALRERPLVAMEVSLLGYQGLSYRETAAALARLRDRCRLVGGQFTLLWHNDRLLARRARRTYESAIQGV